MLIRCFIYANADTVKKTKDKFDRQSSKIWCLFKTIVYDYIAGEGAI